MAIRRVRRTDDSRSRPRWRAELHPDGWRIFMFGGLMADRLTEVEARVWLAEQRVQWDDLVDD